MVSDSIDIKKAGGWIIVLAVSFIVLGLIAIVEPAIAGLALTIWMGWLLIFGGLVYFVGAFRGRGFGGAIWQLLLAAIYLVSGVYFLTHPLAALTTLTLLLAGIFFAEAVLEVIVYFQTRSEGGGAWRLFHAAISLLLALMIWNQWPSSSVWVIGTLVGINLIMVGFSRLMLGMVARRIGRLAHA